MTKSTRNLGVFAPMFDVGDVFLDHTAKRPWKQRLFSWPWRPWDSRPRYKIVEFIDETTVKVEHF